MNFKKFVVPTRTNLRHQNKDIILELYNCTYVSRKKAHNVPITIARKRKLS